MDVPSIKTSEITDRAVQAIENLSKSWGTKIEFQTKENVSVSGLIKYLTGILQGDCLSLLLFELCVNPLSHLLKTTCAGYNIGLPGERTTKITHLLFVDDLKTYASNQSIARKQLELITQFTNDIGMRFGIDKCAYLYMEKGKKKLIGP